MKKVLIVIWTSVFLLSCVRDNQQEPNKPYDFIDGSILNQELKTQQEMYEWSDWNTRWHKSREARRLYIAIRDSQPQQALEAYIEYYNWMYYGHPLAEKIATMSVEMDNAGETTLENMLTKLNLEIEMMKDLAVFTKEDMKETQKSIRFWTELSEEIIRNGGKVEDCKIEFSISELTLD